VVYARKQRYKALTNKLNLIAFIPQEYKRKKRDKIVVFVNFYPLPECFSILIVLNIKIV